MATKRITRKQLRKLVSEAVPSIWSDRQTPTKAAVIEDVEAFLLDHIVADNESIEAEVVDSVMHLSDKVADVIWEELRAHAGDAEWQ